MTKITPAAQALIDLAAKEWSRHKAYMNGLEAQIRARVEAETAEEKNRSALKVANALQVAIDGGATKSALKLVTTKDRTTFESYLALLDPSTDDVDVLPALPVLAPAFEVERLSEDVVNITLDPTNVAATDFDRNDPNLWTGSFEVFRRPGDGKVFIDPTGSGSSQAGIAVTEWLRADEVNTARVVATIEASSK